MKTVKAPRTSVSRSAVSIPALLLLGALSGTALAATDIQQPCPKAADRTDALETFIAHKDTTRPLVRTVDASEAATPVKVADSDAERPEENEATKATPATDSSEPAYTTRLPGVSANDMPGFRRHMYRTDI